MEEEGGEGGEEQKERLDKSIGKRERRREESGGLSRRGRGRRTERSP